MRFRKFGRTTLVAGLAAALGLAAAGPASAGTQTDLGSSFAKPLGGSVALARLGDRLGAVAAQNDLTQQQLRDQLKDPTIRLDRSGRLLAIDPIPRPAPTTVDAPDKGPYPYSDTFLLHSKPGSSKVIYLDFDGEALSGTAWNSYYSVSTAFQAGYSLDTSSSFSTTEMDAIQGIFQRVAEDFAPFDVDVTTQDPGVAAIDRAGSGDNNYGTRALITNSEELSYKTCQSSCGGIAYLGVYDHTSSHQYYQPALVFSHMLSLSEKYIAEAVSHEVGHNLGLNHDGTSSVTYYTGHGPWAPIMGVGYYRPVTQWSRGEYADANNTEDDFAVMSSNGLVARTDDHGDSTATATPLPASSPATTSGIISTRSDKDVFAVSTTCTATLTASVAPAPRSPNLDVQLSLLSATGAPLAISNPSAAYSTYDLATGLNAATSTTVAPGTYYLEVDGVGADSPSTGYSDYASLGQYTITVSGCVGPPSSTSYTKISAGSFHTCAVTSSGGVKCWGDNRLGQLGNGTLTSSTTPVQVSGLTSGVQAIWAGRDHTCAMTTTGAIKCWGNNLNGQLGDGTKINRSTPVQVVGLTSGAKAITAGGAFSCAVTPTSAVKCWGLRYAVTPKVVSGAGGAVQLTAGENHACTLTSARAAKCWGSNTSGQVGDGTTTTRMSAVQVKGMASGVSAVWAGRYHTCAYTTAGAAKCWGTNGNHELGDTTTTMRLTPVAVYGLSSGVVGMRGGVSFTCAVKSTRQLLCWGRNAEGQLGNGTNTEMAIPTAVSGFSTDTAMIAAGSWHTCALKQSNGAAYCWGSNSRGQLGDGTTTWRTTPAKVLG
ncbi:MAG: M12 family metallo-peptidase [Tetrasphaera jenkinsii]|jgi:alpha-tubulin suppressor-like RCC1 family protein|nr:M12 family metallo-peptidase [Tetrasphaera jenkinsii]